MRKALYFLALILLLSACSESKKQHISPPEAESSKSAGKKSARLFGAVYAEDIDALKEMLAAGADIDGRDEEGCTPLLVAVRRGSTELAKFLITAGADVNAKYIEPEVDETEMTGGGIIDLDGPCYDGETPLHLAARDGEVGLARLLLRNGAKIDIKDADGHLPLVEAVLGDNLELVKLLVSHGPGLSYRDEKGRTLLHVITESQWIGLDIVTGEGELIKYLIDNGISPNAKDNNGRTPLHATVENEASALAEFLIKHGANVNLADSDGYTPLDLALKSDLPHCIMLLHQHKGRTSREEPANIPEAVIMEDMQRIRSFISQGKDVNEEYTYNDTGLHYAAEQGRVDIAKLLISSGAHPDKKDNVGRTPLYVAVFNNDLNLCKLLVEHGADVNVNPRLSVGKTLLHKAVIHGNLGMCELLVKNGAHLNKKDDAIHDLPGRTPLDLAIHEGHKEIEQLLRSHDAKTGKELEEDK